VDRSRPARLLAAALSIAVHFLLRAYFGSEPYIEPLLWASAFAFVTFVIGTMLIEDSLWVLDGAQRWIIAFGSTARIAIRVWHDIKAAVAADREPPTNPRDTCSKRNVKSCVRERRRNKAA